MTDQADTIFADDTDDDRTYFRRRAEWHERRAALAADDSTRRLHQRFVKIYALRSESQTST